MQDDRTQNLNLTLPHPDNKLEEDVLRLRDAMAALDAACAALAVGKANAQDLQTAIAGLQNGINNLGTTVTFLTNSKVGVVNGLAGPDVTLEPEHLKLGPANGPGSIAISYDSQGRAATMTQKFNGKTATTTLGYDSQGRVAQVQAEYNGRTRTETLSYDPQGRLSGATAVEVSA